MAKIEIINAQWISIDRLVNNEGQIPDVPKNPRTIDPEEYETLKRSLTEDPEFLGIREIVAYPIGGGTLVVLDGNQRFRACKELGFEKCPDPTRRYTCTQDASLRGKRQRLKRKVG